MEPRQEVASALRERNYQIVRQFSEETMIREAIETRIDLNWARQHLHGFGKYFDEVQTVKASEAEYQALKAKIEQEKLN